MVDKGAPESIIKNNVLILNECERKRILPKNRKKFHVVEGTYEMIGESTLKTLGKSYIFYVAINEFLLDSHKGILEKGGLEKYQVVINCRNKIISLTDAESEIH